jgi:tetratricopeptide (TPR) repeat protein
MPLQPSEDFAANYFNPTNAKTRYIHDHLFPAANTGIAAIRKGVLGTPPGGTSSTSPTTLTAYQPAPRRARPSDEMAELDQVITVQSNFLKGSLRVDIFGLKEGGDISGKLIAPLRPEVPALKRGQTYLIEVVLRTLKLGHPFSQGTVDSNEIWVDAKVQGGEKVWGRNGGLGRHKEVDPWSHFVNVYMLDRDGNRIDRRNPQDIFTPLYNHQIPPGAARVVHYSFSVPPDAPATMTLDVKLNYRKFDTIYMNYVFGKGYSNGLPFQLTNELPIVTIASDTVTFPIDGGTSSTSPTSTSSTSPTSNNELPETLRDRSIAAQTNSIPPWQRWNDYGIGLFLEGTDKGSEKGQLLQAAEAFERVEKLGRYDGPLNLARVYFKEGRLEDAVAALRRASEFNPPAPRWTVAWLNGLVNKQNGYLDQAISELRSILEDRYEELDRRGFDFSLDYEVINELGQTLFERAKQERGDPSVQRRWLTDAVARFKRTLELDSENVTAHHNLAIIYERLGDREMAAQHRALHERYRADDNARDRAVAIARRRDPAADHAAQATVIYPLQRNGAFELEPARRPGVAASPQAGAK